MIHVKAEVFADAGEEKLEDLGDGKYRVWVRELPRDNMANRKVVELIAEHYKIGKGDVKIVKGHKSPKKLLEVGHN